MSHVSRGHMWPTWTCIRCLVQQPKILLWAPLLVNRLLPDRLSFGPSLFHYPCRLPSVVLLLRPSLSSTHASYYEAANRKVEKRYCGLCCCLS